MNNYLRAKVIRYLQKKRYIYNYEKVFFAAQNGAPCSSSICANSYCIMYKQQEVWLPQPSES